MEMYIKGRGEHRVSKTTSWTWVGGTEEERVNSVAVTQAEENRLTLDNLSHPSSTIPVWKNLITIWIVKKEKNILRFQLKWRDYASVFANQAAWPKSAPIESVCTNIQLQAKEELFLQVPQSKYDFHLFQQAGMASFFTLKPSLGVTC